MLLGLAGPAQAASWVCGAISASGGTGWSVADSKAQAQANALAQCGGGCFITGCEFGVGQTVEEAERTKPKDPPRVFNDVPERKVLPAPVTRPQPVRQIPIPRATVSTPSRQPEAKKAAATPAPASKGTTTTTRNSDCYQPDRRLPTAKKIEVNPCADNVNALGQVYVPQDRIDHQGPRAERYIRSLANCRQVVNGVCIDDKQKTPKSEAGGPIYMPR